MTGVLPQNEIEARLNDLPGWEIIEGQLSRTFVLPTFAHAVLFLAAAGQLAEAAGHHPDFLLRGYNKLTIQLITHSAGGLTEKDFDLAAQIDRLPHKKVK